MTDAGVVTVATRPFAVAVGLTVGVGAITGTVEADAEAAGESDVSALLAAASGLGLTAGSDGTGPTVESDAVVVQTCTPTAAATTNAAAVRALVVIRICRRRCTPATTACRRSARGCGASLASRRRALAMSGSRSSLMRPPSQSRELSGHLA